MGAAQSSAVPNEVSVASGQTTSQDDLTAQLLKITSDLEIADLESVDLESTHVANSPLASSPAPSGSDGGLVIRSDKPAVGLNDSMDSADGNAELENREQRLERKRAEMDAFYNEVVNKREARNKALGDIARKLRRMEKMEEELEKEREEKQTLELHCKALKEVNKITKEMLRIRETQVCDLKSRLKDVEKKLMESPEEIKVEYEKQMTNYKKLRELYEQRAVAAELEHKTMIEKELAKNALLEAKLKEIQEEIQAQLEKYKENKRQILEMETNILAKDDEINHLNESLTESLAENHILNSQMTLVNNLFSNMLINPMINLDLLIKLIQDNYLLIIDLINNHEINDTVSLLVDLEKKIDQETLEGRNQMKQLEGSEASCSNADDLYEKTDQDEAVVMDKSHIQKEIANNLPKVWRILIELLNTHQEQYENNEENENFESCYKNVKTNSGQTHQVISVSQTYIRLKHLILEKNHLTNQLAKLKTLNNHLEIRLNHSEQRLNTVTTELKKTWNVVNKLKLQHKQLYTHEKILKYELKHKRNMINDLKIDLEYVREKWDLVKEKNEQNEMDYKVLRKEFALRRLQYDGGRSTSESGISTDTEDDNVEIVETNDESDDDKSEVVETQSEHDVPRTNSVMSMEEDEGDEVEELEIEANERVENASESVIEPFVETNIVQGPMIDGRDGVPEESAVLQGENVELILNNVPENISPSQIILENASNYEVSTPSYPGETRRSLSQSSENEPSPGRYERGSEEKLSQIINNNKVTVKTIGGKIKIVTESLLNKTSQAESILMKGESSQTDVEKANPPTFPNESFIACKETTIEDENKTDICTLESTSSQSVPETHDEQRTKRVTRQERIAEETLDVESSSKEESSPCQNTTPIDLQNDIQLSVESSKVLVDTVQSKVDDLKRVLSARRQSSVNTSNNHSSKCLPQSRTAAENSSEAAPSTTERHIHTSKDDLKQTVHTSDAAPDKIPPPPPLPTSISVERIPASCIKIPESTSSCYNPSSSLSAIKSSSSASYSQQDTSSDTSTSYNTSNSPSRTRTPEEILEARNARLKRLEDQTKNLFHKMSLTSQRSDTLSERLVELHEYYGGSNERADRSPRRVREGSNDSNESRDRLHAAESQPRQTDGVSNVPERLTTQNESSPSELNTTVEDLGARRRLE